MLALCTAGLALAFQPAQAQEAPPPKRIAVFDWGLAETLLSLGVTPVALCETAGYRQWVIEPPLPAGVADAGLRIEPNFELIASAKPDLILITPELEPLRPMLERIAATETLAIYAPGGDVWSRAREAAMTMAKLIGREAEGQAFIARVDATIETARRKLGKESRPPLYLVNFLDRRHVRIYGRGSIFQTVLDRLGLANAYTGPTSFWGFATFGIEHLAETPHAQLLYFEPLPEEVHATFETSPLWAALSFAREGRVQALPPVWSFGGIASGERLSRLLSEQLSEKKPTEAHATDAATGGGRHE